MLALILICFSIPSSCFVVIILVYRVYSITQLSGMKNISVFVLVRCQKRYNLHGRTIKILM